MSIQTSDAALKALQAPELILGGLYSGGFSSFSGVNVKLPATLNNVAPGDFSGAGGFEPSAVTSIQGTAGTNVAINGTDYNPVNGNNAAIAITNRTVDPGLIVTSLAGGNTDTIESLYPNGGNASLSFDSTCTFSTLAIPLVSVVTGADVTDGTSTAAGGSATLTINGLPNLASLDLHTLTTLSTQGYNGGVSIIITNNPNLASVDLSGLSAVNFVDSPYGAPLIVSMTISFNGCALDVASVNALLIKLASLSPTLNLSTEAATLDLTGGTNATPTGAGATAKTTLIAAGWGVTTN